MTQKLRRGFRVEAEYYASEFRRELNLREFDPLPARVLAELLDIRMLRLSAYDGISDSLKMHYAGERGKSDFSGTVLFDGVTRHILYNDYQHENRQNSSIMHEISHIILRHPPCIPFAETGKREFESVYEAEANALGFTLLVPKRAALSAIEDFPVLAQAASHFGVSMKLLRHRIDISDAQRWARNRAAKRVA